MKRIFTRSLPALLALVLALGVATPAMAATYRPGAQSGPSGSYAGSRYYENYKRVPITGDCFLYSPGWNGGLITVDNANIRYTLNVVFTWDPVRQINVVKSVSQGIGNATASIQLSEGEWMVACHDWETGIPAGDNPVAYSGTNYSVLKSLKVGDGVKLSGCTALTHDTYVEPGAFLKFIPADAVVMHGENTGVTAGKAVLFTPDFNGGILTAANSGINPLTIGDNVCATLYAYVDGYEVSVQIPQYSVLKYCDNLEADYVFKITIGSEEYTYTTEDLITDESGNLFLKFDKLRAIQLGEKITATIWDGDTQVGRTVEYSVYTYVQKNQNTSDEAIRELLEAIYNYGESAKNA